MILSSRVRRRGVDVSHVFGLAVLALIQPVPVTAQDPWPVAAEVYVGASRGYTDSDDTYRGDRAGPLLEVLAGARLHSADRAGAFVSLLASLHAVNTLRTADCRLAPDGSCTPWYPGFGVVSLLAGWESRSTTLRLQGGPGFVTSDGEDTTGIVARLDAALPLIERLSAVTSLSALVVPSYNEDRFYSIAFGVGLRLR